MIIGNCHCSAIKIELSEPPVAGTRCNCSICRKYAAVWAYYTEQTVQICTGTTPTATYCWGDKFIKFHHCVKCGCVTHYTSTAKGNSDRIAVNLNMMSEQDIANVKIRNFDGAGTWKFLD